MDTAAAKKRFAPWADSDGDCVRCGETYEEEGHACAEGFLPSDEECIAAALGLLPAALERIDELDRINRQAGKAAFKAGRNAIEMELGEVRAERDAALEALEEAQGLVRRAETIIGMELEPAPAHMQPDGKIKGAALEVVDWLKSARAILRVSKEGKAT